MTHLEAKSSFLVFEIGASGSGTINGLVVNEDSAGHIWTSSDDGNNSAAATFHNLLIMLRFWPNFNGGLVYLNHLLCNLFGQIELW